MFLEPVCIQEIITVMNSIKTNAAGVDNISKQIIKNNFNTIAKHLVKIINQSFAEGVVPNVAKIIPFYKSGDKNTLGNYRPVAILPLFSKIWEKLFYDRLMKFLDRHNILYTHQYGFRPKYSIDYAVMSLQNYIIKEFEKGNYTIGIFLDLSKAFDTLDKNLLLNKLHSYGIRGIPNKWINSYLSDRNQHVQLRNILSDKNFIDTGVPQGSVLGPVMFLLYVNDLPNFDNKVFTLMFADDSSLFISGPNLDELNASHDQTKNIIIKVQNWINTNKLSLNLKKTKFMIFSTRDIKEHEYINVRNFKIERVRLFKFLGFFEYSATVREGVTKFEMPGQKLLKKCLFLFIAPFDL